jgi:serine/threonine-protein kinase HipA
LAEIRHEGYSPAALRLLTGGNRKFPFRLPFGRDDFLMIQLETIDHMSISGMQDKISMVLKRGILEPEENRGEYILKPVPSQPIPFFADDVPANEHLTMQVASQVFRINTASNACLDMADGSMAYLTRRFDYRNGRKIPQEDFCQLSGRSPEEGGRNYKYNGSYEEMGRIVKRFCKAHIIELEKLFRLIVFNYLVSNGDAHLKNFSLHESPFGDYVLTPAYDLICTSMHFPDESRTALDLFDEHESGFFRANGFYGRDDFMMLAEMYGLNFKRAKKILDIFPANRSAVRNLVGRSFLSEEAKTDYMKRFDDRLLAIK